MCPHDCHGSVYEQNHVMVRKCENAIKFHSFILLVHTTPMLLRRSFGCRRPLLSLRGSAGGPRLYSALNLNNEDEKPARKQRQLSPQEAKEEAAKVAMQGLKDIGTMFSFSAGNDEATRPIDSAPIYKDPSKFASLSLLHQGQICSELQQLYDRKWSKMTPEQKRLGYYIAYGNYDVREDFDNWKDPESPPYDLPFVVPSVISTTNPKPHTKVRKLPPVELSKTPVRVKQFATNKIDGVSRFFMYVILLISMVAIYRDKNIGEEGKPQSADVVDPYYESPKEPEPEVVEPTQRRRKWYWLYLR
ncbi:hypothetical protein PGUG_05642 [Meyerozyma guilliermondii ATCC 6260]|uniref:Genetic interactor of prohibitin 7, mitochondrial n=1 Tax=Meyerozyma guilliermondii (strain ATCC 6260 / CBS 566 / DSM 6381 / JCM 1539 / NBRC 10279 / NRRL Y-324) TaxID=294746 RepID=A5DQU1_PICGU|nr:uncharacterized protein PGUG_05642 [Meyerozyma guilliermondii ATCC 6260]EDK41544.2 hypothetical protein PGUG_05642 [Meyerozyma guilliermondii ATCC 6260]